MEFVTEEVLARIVEGEGITDDVESVISSESEAAVGHGENYCSNIVRIHLKLKLSSNEIFTKSIVLKIFLTELSDMAEKEMRLFFANEAVMYDKILKALENLGKKYNLNCLRLWPNCYFATPDVMIFNDLKEIGFVVPARHEGLKLDDAFKVMYFLGRFHALSVTGARRKLIDPLQTRREYTWIQKETLITELTKNMIFVAGETVMSWGDQWRKPGMRIQAYSESMTNILRRLYYEDVPLKVINHGDVWINNFMAKYNSNNVMQEIRFVDFQNSFYNSYGWDLIYFLYSSIKGDIMLDNYDALLTVYREQFVDTLRNVGEDTAIAPSLDEIKADIRRLHPFCLTITCATNAVVFNVSKEPIDIEDLSTNLNKIRNVFTSDNWKSTMQTKIKYFQQHKLL